MTIQKNWATRLLGIAFLWQAATSLISNAVFADPLMAEGNMAQTMLNLAANAGHVHIAVLMETMTAVGIILLGTMLYHFLKSTNEPIARFGFAMYVFEAVVLFAKQILLLMVFKTGQMYMATGGAELLPLGEVFGFAKTYAGQLNMLIFGLGAIAFYSLLVKSRIIPRWMSIYGLATVPLILIFVPLMNYGVEVPFWVLAPYVPFEFVTGTVILVRGIKRTIL